MKERVALYPHQQKKKCRRLQHFLTVPLHHQKKNNHKATEVTVSHTFITCHPSLLSLHLPLLSEDMRKEGGEKESLVKPFRNRHHQYRRYHQIYFFLRLKLRTQARKKVSFFSHHEHFCKISLYWEVMQSDCHQSFWQKGSGKLKERKSWKRILPVHVHTCMYPL